MKKITSIFGVFVLLFVVLLGFISDDAQLKAIVSKLEKFREANPQEKVHLHFDKPFYATGDEIWFKAYVVNAESHNLSDLSKILNLDLINENDSITQSLRVRLNAGLGWGSFHLPDTLKAGNYRIRAYTNYMRNFDDAYFFDKTIPIGNVTSNNIISTIKYNFETQDDKQNVKVFINYTDLDCKAIKDKKVTYEVQIGTSNIALGKTITDENGNIQINFISDQSAAVKLIKLNTILKLDEDHSITKSFPINLNANKIDVQFFPESGNLIYGIRSKVAFKAVGTDGIGKKISGYISNNDGQKILEFESEHAGMGTFTLKPIAGQTYIANVKFPDGSESKFLLPKAETQGFILSVDNLDSTNLVVKINASSALVAEGGDVTLIAQSNSVIKFVSKNKVDNSILIAKIPKNRFPTGILQLTVFNQLNQPVAERLVFINHNDFLNVSLKGPKASAIRKKVKIDLDVKDNSGKPVLGSFSVAVTDAVKVNLEDESTILTNLLLTSDIKGYVEKPNYYFTAVSEQKISHLDNLMLTQGWRRFNWKNILSDNYPSLLYQPENGITISGRITQKKKPIIGGKVMLMSPNGGMFLQDTLSNDDGQFSFSNLMFIDSTRFLIQARTAKDKAMVDIELDKNPFQMVSKKVNNTEINFNNALNNYLKNNSKQYEALRNKGIMLNEITIKEKRKSRVVEGSSNLSGYADVVINSEELETAVTTGLNDFLVGRVAGLEIRDSVAFLTRSMYSNLKAITPMMLIYDGIRVDPVRLGEINPIDVEGVEILKGSSASIYGMQGGGGVIIVTSKMPGIRKNPVYTADGVLTFYPKGYYKTREFYMPNYDGPISNQNIPDLRTTIYWQPNIIVKDGKASFEFFNSDGKGLYKITLEGIDLNGNLARHIYNYQVD